MFPGTEAAFRMAMRPVPVGCVRLSEEAYAEGLVNGRHHLTEGVGAYREAIS